MQTEIRAIRTGGSGEEVALKASRDGDLRIAQFLPEFAMLCASGVVFGADITPSTAQAPNTTAPTTTAEWGIYNADDSKHIVLLSVGIALQSGTAGLGLCIMAAAGKGPQTQVTANYSTGAAMVISCLDGTLKIPNFYVSNGVTVVGGQPAWQTIAAIDMTASNGVGNGLIAHAKDIAGLFMAPPKGGIYVEVVGEAGSTALWDISFIVAQLDLDS